MAYRIHLCEPLHDEFLRIAHEQIDRAIESMSDEALDQGAIVHQVRKRCKKVRGLARLFRPALEDAGLYQRTNERFRDIGRVLSRYRDVDVMVQTFDQLAQSGTVDTRAPTLQRMRLILEDSCETMYAQECEGTLSDVRMLLERGREEIETVELDHTDFGQLLRGLRKTYGRARRMARNCERKDSAEQRHEWRKRVKYHRYHVRLLREIWPDAMSVRETELDRLGKVLGDEHDLNVLAEFVCAQAEDFGGARQVQEFRGLARRHGKQMLSGIDHASQCLFAEKPDAFADRMNAYYNAATRNVAA